MIQRIQSLWLLLAALSVCLLFFFPVATFIPNSDYGIYNFTFHIYGLDCMQPFSDVVDGLYAPLLKYTVIVVVLVSVFTPFLAIFKYKNRTQQVRLSHLTILLNAALTVAFFLLLSSFAEKTDSIDKPGVGIYLPIVAIIFLLLSIRFIKKDDKLVRSADRVR